MPESIEINPVAGVVEATIQPPGSKSLTNRALIIAALSQGQSVLDGALDSDDTHVMIDSLQKLGVSVTHDNGKNSLFVVGCGGQVPVDSAELFVDNSGTSIRFLTAALGVAGGNYRLDGIPRMRERPIGPLVDALSAAGATIVAESPNQCPPVQINSARLAVGKMQIKGNLSSQYLSGLLMASPLFQDGMTIDIDGPLISKPYVEMTMSVMKEFGVDVVSNAPLSRFEVAAGQAYIGKNYQIEPDASAASYFWAIAAICGGTATVQNLNRESLQGDVDFVLCLKQMGCEVKFNEDSISVSGPAKRGIDVDMSNVSDTVQTLSAVALFVDGKTTVRNIAHNRVKETDRIGNLAIELRKFGAEVDDFEDGLSITPPTEIQPAEIETYNDHRMAMSLALVGLRRSGVVIKNPNCVSKTYPRFFDDLKSFCE